MQLKKEYEMKNLIFVILADREVEFYISVAKKLQNVHDYNIEFLSFYEPKNHFIKDFKVINFYDYLIKSNHIYKYEQKSLFHERVTFGLNKKINLEEKMNSYIYTLTRIFHNYRDKIYFIHELGGWIAPQSVLSFCKLNHHINIFLEPSFFKGKLDFLINNNLFQKRTMININNYKYSETNKILQDYRLNFLKKRDYIIPDKDKHNFKSIYFSKLFTLKNAKIILYKIIQKNILKKKFEYSYYFNYTKRYFFMLLNKFKLRKLYQSKIDFKNEKKYIFFPVHFSLDFSVTIRANEYFNQILLLENILDIIPSNTYLIIKEHPVSAGLFNYKILNKFLINKKNVILLDPYINIHEFIENIDLVLTINSKAGFEAIIDGINTICIKDSFYKNFLDNLGYNKLNSKTLNYLLNSSKKIEKKKVSEFVKYYINNLLNGELYNNDEKNTKEISLSISKLITKLN